eukprot:6855348-Pyramimonas_sp.AAC.1
MNPSEKACIRVRSSISAVSALLVVVLCLVWLAWTETLVTSYHVVTSDGESVPQRRMLTTSNATYESNATRRHELKLHGLFTRSKQNAVKALVDTSSVAKAQNSSEDVDLPQ